ncbi:MAG: DUF2807 domain-containing protein [Rhodocyclaceae bacterium]|nr:DUF2807 domain-containing protein [Rhodocyclaceae bacterium]
MAMPLPRALVALATAAWLVAVTPATAGGGAVFESRAVGAFDRIDLDGPADLVFTSGDRHAVVVEAEPALQARIRVRTAGGRLHFDYGAAPLQTRHALRFHVSAPRLDALSTRGSGDAHLGPMAPPAFTLAAEGSGDVHLEAIDTARLSIAHQGAGDLRVTGRCGRLAVAADESGELDLARLACDEASIHLDGSGDARAQVRERLDATLSGSGDLIVIGRPQVAARTLGVGELRFEAAPAGAR